MNPFETITTNWPAISAWVEQAEALPTSKAEFVDRYGTFEGDGEDADSTQAALLSAQAMAAELGDPADVKKMLANNGAYLTGEKPPSMYYGRVIWWSTQVANVDDTAEQTVAGVAGLDADGVRTLLTGSGGITSALDTAAAATNALQSDLSNAGDRLMPQVQAIAGTGMFNTARQWLAGYDNRRSTLMQDAAKAYKAWKGKSMPAGSEPPTVEQAEANPSGWRLPFSGSKADDKAAYAKAVEAITEGDKDKVAKNRFISEVAGLDTKGNSMLPALVAVGGAITQVSTTLSQANLRFADVAKSADATQLSDPKWMATAVDLADLTTLKTQATAFTQSALVEN